MQEKESLQTLKECLKSVKKFLKWCKDNAKPQEYLDIQNKLIKQLMQEIKIKKQILKKRQSGGGIGLGWTSSVKR